MTTPICPDFLIHRAAPPKRHKHRSNAVIGKAAYRPRLRRKPLMRGLTMGLAVLGIAFSTSAHATTGLLCAPITGADPKLSLIIGADGVTGANLFERGRWLSTFGKNAPFTMVHSSIDKREARLDLVSREASRSKVRLRVRMMPLHPPRWIQASGTLQRLGRTYRVNCVQD